MPMLENGDDFRWGVDRAIAQLAIQLGLIADLEHSTRAREPEVQNEIIARMHAVQGMVATLDSVTYDTTAHAEVAAVIRGWSAPYAVPGGDHPVVVKVASELTALATAYASGPDTPGRARAITRARLRLGVLLSDDVHNHAIKHLTIAHLMELMRAFRDFVGHLDSRGASA